MNTALQPIGWREWVSLPNLDIPAIKAKIDTGARTSCLHAYDVDCFTAGKTRMVRFGLHPLPRRTDISLHREAVLIDQRQVRDSGGHVEERYVIQSPVRLGDLEWNIELTLTSRDDMLFRMLLGRTALRGRFVVDTGRSYVLGKRKKKVYQTFIKDNEPRTNP